MSEYTQGIWMNGAAILKNGEMLTIEEILEVLRAGEEAKEQATAYRISLENLEAEHEKLKVEWERLASMDLYAKHLDLIKRHAQKILEQGNE